MDPQEARLACLKIMADKIGQITDAETVVKQAQKMADFVIGPVPRESLRAGAPKGADEK